MPTLTRWFLKTALLCLIATLLVAVLLSTGRIWTLLAVFAGLGPVYFHLFMVGWVTELIFGVVLGTVLTLPPVAVTLGRLLELLAVLAFTSHIRPRIVPRN